MSLCSKSGEIACGTLGCRASTRCCQADIGYGCQTGASCFTNAGSIGCWWTSSAEPSGTRPCFGYADAAIGDTCGSANWCQVCSSTEYPFCYTNIILGAEAPLTAVSCDAFTGITTITAADASTNTIRLPTSPTSTSPTSTSTSTSRGPTRVPTPPLITPPPTPPAPPTPTASATPALPTAAVAGIGIGAFFAVAVIALLAFFLYRKQNRSPPPPPPLPGYVDYAHPAPQAEYAYGAQVPVHGLGLGQDGAKPPVVERYEVPG